jgi:RNA polymerase sigma-70 factor (ECF subfamily)
MRIACAVEEREEDDRAVRAILAGDTEAFDALARAYRGRLLGICFRYTGNRDDADDVVQDVLLRAYRGLSGFRGEASFRTWLFRIAVNACLNWTAGRRWRGAPDSELSALVDPKPSPAERLAQKEKENAVRRAVAGLPERQRITLLLRVYEDLSHKEIAEVMGCSVGTVKANFFFALKNLRKQFENRDDGHARHSIYE